MKGLKHLSYKKRLRVMKQFTVEKAQLASINVYKYLKGRVQSGQSQAFLSHVQ